LTAGVQRTEFVALCSLQNTLFNVVHFALVHSLHYSF